MPSLNPRFDQVTQLPLLFKLDVPRHFVDQNGHMNVHRYFEVGMRGIGELFEQVGIADRYRNTTQQSSFGLEHHVRYYAEVHVGDVLAVHIRIVGRSEKIVHGVVVLANQSRREVASTLEFVDGHVDLHSRRIIPWPDHLAAAFDRMLAATNDLQWWLPTCATVAGSGSNSAQHRRA